MALMDVTDLLSDPDFAVGVGEISVTRNAETLVNGRATLSGSTIDISAGSGYSTVVVAASNRVLQMLPSAAYASGAIEVYSTFTFSGPALNRAPDLVNWQNAVYQVEHIDNYTNFGAGFNCATCSLKDV